MSEAFNVVEYNNFLKQAYKQADIIYIDFDSVIRDISVIATGKFAELYGCVIGTKVEYDNNIPYTRLVLSKKYSLYKYLQEIDDWDEFSAMDDVSEMRIESIEFVKNQVEFAQIVSDYRNYNNDFYFYKGYTL
jgi:hypothetical protein